jgi:hypothetical protein
LRFPSAITVKNSAVDDTAPQLVRIRAISPLTVNVSAGPATFKFELTAKDDLSGFKEAEVSFKYEDVDGGSVESFETFPDSTLDTSGKPVAMNITWEFDARTPTGKHELQITLSDEANNKVTFDSEDLSRLGYPSEVNVVNTNTDFEAPELIDVKALSPTTVDVSREAGEVKIQVTVRDDGVGFKLGSVSIVEPENFVNISVAEFSITPTADVALTFNLTLPIPRYLQSGSYDIAITLIDAVSNEFYPFDSTAELFSIDVINSGTVDTEPPELLDFTLLTPTTVDPLTKVTTMTFQVEASDELSGMRLVVVSLEGPQYYEIVEVIGKTAVTGKPWTVNATFVFKENFAWSDEYKFDVYLFDDVANLVYITSDELAELGFVSTLPLVPDE